MISWPRLKIPSGLNNKITDQNIYLTDPLQNNSKCLEEYFTLKIPYKNPKICLKIVLLRLDFSPLIRRFLT